MFINLTQERRRSYIEDGRHYTNGEIVDEAESMS
jgi:transcriptional regulator of met regulon